MKSTALISFLAPFIALVTGVDHSIGGDGTDYPTLPRKPYGATAFLIDYGMLLDDYGYILSSSSELSNTALRASIRAFLAPLKEYQASFSQGETVSDARRKEHLIGQAAFLATEDSFQQSSISFADWKSANMWNSVIGRSSFNAALVTRNGLFNNITDRSDSSKALETYQIAMTNYTKILNLTKEAEFGKIVAKDLDWNLLESRYYQLVRTLRSSGGDADKAAVIRAYLTGFLRDGDSNDDAYNEIVKLSSTRDDYYATKTKVKTNTKTKTSSKYRFTTTASKRASPSDFDDEDSMTSTGRLYKRVMRKFDFWDRSSGDRSSRTGTYISTKTNSSTSTSTKTRTNTVMTISGRTVCGSSSTPVETIEIRAGGGGQTQTVQCSCTTRGKRLSATVSSESTSSSRYRWFTSAAPSNATPTLIAIFASVALAVFFI